MIFSQTPRGAQVQCGVQIGYHDFVNPVASAIFTGFGNFVVRLELPIFAARLYILIKRMIIRLAKAVSNNEPARYSRLEIPGFVKMLQGSARLGSA